MRIMLSVIVGIIGGYIMGVALSSLIGTIGMLGFGVPLGIKYLSIYLAIIGAFLVPIIDRNVQRKRHA